MEIVQIAPQVGAVLVAKLGVFRQHTLDDVIERIRYLVVQPPGRSISSALLGLEQLDERVAAKRFDAGQTAVEHAAQGVDVAAAVDVFGIARLFRRHVDRRAGRVARAGQRQIVRDALGQAEIGDLHHPLARDENVVRFDVAMDEVVVVGVLQAIDGSHDDVQGIADPQALQFREPTAQGLAIHVLHRQEMVAALFADGEAPHDMRVVEFGHQAGFALKAVDEGRVAGQMLGQHLDGDVAIQTLLCARYTVPVAPLAIRRRMRKSPSRSPLVCVRFCSSSARSVGVSSRSLRAPSGRSNDSCGTTCVRVKAASGSLDAGVPGVSGARGNPRGPQARPEVASAGGGLRPSGSPRIAPPGERFARGQAGSGAISCRVEVIIRREWENCKHGSVSSAGPLPGAAGRLARRKLLSPADGHIIIPRHTNRSEGLTWKRISN